MKIYFDQRMAQEALNRDVSAEIEPHRAAIGRDRLQQWNERTTLKNVLARTTRANDDSRGPGLIRGAL